jgi:hypothetical protein
MTHETKKQRQERSIEELLRRLREAPAGERVYMRVGDVFKRMVKQVESGLNAVRPRAPTP